MTFQQFRSRVLSPTPVILEASVCSAHLGLLYFSLVQLDAEDLRRQPLEAEVHLRKEGDDDKLALAQIPARALSIFSQSQIKRASASAHRVSRLC